MRETPRKKFTQKEVDEMIKDHERWLHDSTRGKKADFSGAELIGLNFRGAALVHANFANSSLNYSWFVSANLRGCNFTGCTLVRTSFAYTDLVHARFDRSTCLETNFSWSELSKASFKHAELSGVNFYSADVVATDLSKVTSMCDSIGLADVCPTVGSFIGYKKASNCLITLEIPADAKRSSATSRKCRCDKAKVLAIESLHSNDIVWEVSSDYDSKFIYRVGDTVSVDNFNENRWYACTAGIHFFIDKNDAINY